MKETGGRADVEETETETEMEQRGRNTFFTLSAGVPASSRRTTSVKKPGKKVLKRPEERRGRLPAKVSRGTRTREVHRGDDVRQRYSNDSIARRGEGVCGCKKGSRAHKKKTERACGSIIAAFSEGYGESEEKTKGQVTGGQESLRSEKCYADGANLLVTASCQSL